MGLDNYAVSVRPPEDWTDPDEDFYLAPEAEAALRSAQAEIERLREYCVFERSYFRGKTYMLVIQDVTGVYIGADWIPPETVRMMAGVLSQCDPDETARDYDHSPGEISDLIIFFRLCAEHKLGLVGSS